MDTRLMRKLLIGGLVGLAVFALGDYLVHGPRSLPRTHCYHPPM